MTVADIGYDFRRRVREREELVGTFVTIAHPTVAEVMALAGFDFLLIDMEHTGLSGSEVQLLLTSAASTRVPTLVRVPVGDEIFIKPVLDAGACGIAIPHARSGEQMAAVVAATRYPPTGTRGLTAARAAGYGMDFKDYAKKADDAITVIALIEDTEGVDAAESIAAVDGVDMIFVGPWDLAASVGRFAETDHPEVLDQIKRVFDIASRAGKSVCIYADDASAGASWRERGANATIIGEDYALLLDAAQRNSVIATRKGTASR